MAENFLFIQPYIFQRLQSLVWSCLDCDLTRTAVFYAERCFAMDSSNHEARHLYVTALLRQGETHSALSLVRLGRDRTCTGCLELRAKCCTLLGRHRQAKDALDECMRDPNFTSYASAPNRTARVFPDEAGICCRSGNMSLKGNMLEEATASYKQALGLNPYIWEAFEGLCTLGTMPEVEDIFPPRQLPVKRGAHDDIPPSKSSGPVATGAGFFTPDTGSSGNLFRLAQPLPFRMESAGPSDSLTSDNSYAQDLTFHQVHPPARPHGQLPHVSRPLSSADEAGPVPKKLRSTAPPGETDRPIKHLKGGVDELSKKVPALSRPIAGSSKSSGHASTTVPGTRRSTRLNSGTGKAAHVSKHTLMRDRRRIPTNHLRSRSMESDMEDEFQSPSPPAIANSPQSETSPSRHDPMLADAYEWELADFYVYDLTRQFATAARALALYNSPKCLVELEKLPPVHQKTPWVLAMIGRAHFEQLEYAKAERAFKALRSLQPYRLLDMEVYSTLLWYLQKHVELSFLAQELLSIEPRCPQAWIAVGNLFSLQKERAHALTCFRRAAQLDPRCAYAYTLSGHESVEEDLDKAINFFQSALRADSRHYNAWYGLGTCYLRMTKVRLAEYHYRKAMDIHPYNAVLVGCVGLAVERYDRGAALKLFDAAVKLAPENALVRYRRSKILIAVKRYPEAIQDLERLRNTAPEESNVVFQLAKAYRLVGNDVKFAATLAQARDMSPKSVAKLKKLLDTVKDDSADDRMDEG